MKWGELITLEYGKPVKDKACTDGAVPVYGTNGKIGTSHLPPLCKHPSFILGRKGAYRGVHYSDVPFSVIDTAFYAEPVSNDIDLKWAYYKFLTYDINRMDSGSAIPSTDRYEIYNIAVDPPPMETQQKIVRLLDAIDAKIQCNQQINENLEQQADAIFSENFLSQELLPVGWTKGHLSSIANYLNGLAMQKHRPPKGELGLPVLKIKELRQGITDDNSERCTAKIKPEYIVHDGDIIFSWSGSLLVDFWCGGDCGLNQHLFKVTSAQFEKWFVYAWTKHYLNHFITVATDKATTMGHIKRDELDKAEVIIPSFSDYTKISSLMQPLYDEIISNRIESRKLSELRDTLLPRLMSGELDVSGFDL